MNGIGRTDFVPEYEVTGEKTWETMLYEARAELGSLEEAYSTLEDTLAAVVKRNLELRERVAKLEHRLAVENKGKSITHW